MVITSNAEEEEETKIHPLNNVLFKAKLTGDWQVYFMHAMNEVEDRKGKKQKQQLWEQLQIQLAS